MINTDKIVPIIDGYKKYFLEHWEDEKYTWEAVKHFQKNWDINAENFGAMFKKATDKAKNLLASGYAYPKKMILDFANADDNATRNMFINLFDEKRDFTERIEEFMWSAEEMRAKYDDGTWKNHYQSINAVSTYLWLMFPDKYYIYKYELYKAVATELDDTYVPKRNGSVQNMVDGFKMYDEINSLLKLDTDIQHMLDSAKTDMCYNDSELKTATIDFGFYLARFYRQKEEIKRCWFVGAYSDSDDAHYDEEYVQQGIWQNGYTDKFLDTVNSVRVGDKIAIKTSYTKKKGLPFDNKGETVSVMNIKIVGTVTVNRMDGRTLDVDWDTSFEEKEWYFYTFRNTITLPKEDDWRTKALIDFVFHDVPQNYAQFQNISQEEDFSETEWLPSLEEYDPALTVKDWLELLQNESIFDDNSMNLMKCFYELGGEASCKELSDKYGKTPYYYNGVSVGLAKRIVKATGCPLRKRDNSDESFWTVPFVGKYVIYNNQKCFCWKLREELKEALKQFISKYAKEDFLTSEIDNEIDYTNLPVSNSEFLKYFAPLIQALKELGGSASRKEAHEKVIELMIYPRKSLAKHMKNRVLLECLIKLTLPETTLHMRVLSAVALKECGYLQS